jgi:hypothetical protein
VGEVVPGISAFTVLSHCPPLPFAQVCAPFPLRSCFCRELLSAFVLLDSWSFLLLSPIAVFIVALCAMRYVLHF